jgi:hypothetical protein
MTQHTLSTHTTHLHPPTPRAQDPSFFSCSMVLLPLHHALHFSLLVLLPGGATAAGLARLRDQALGEAAASCAAGRPPRQACVLHLDSIQDLESGRPCHGQVAEQAVQALHTWLGALWQYQVGQPLAAAQALAAGVLDASACTVCAVGVL